MLRKGRLPKLFGVEACASLVPLAESMSSGDPISTASLERLAPINRIDVGEAQLLAAVADLGDLLLTGDKRALVAVGHLPNFPPLLAGKIVTLEAILISLCSKLGGDLTLGQVDTSNIASRRPCEACLGELVSCAPATPRRALHSKMRLWLNRFAALGQELSLRTRPQHVRELERRGSSPVSLANLAASQSRYWRTSYPASATAEEY
jgi:hypothetical protein